MRRIWRGSATAALALLAAVPFGTSAGDSQRGKQLYESRCIACHSIDENRVGPAHKGVFGRRAGQAEGYDYSPAVKASRLVWNQKNLNRWLANPGKVIPGTKMGYSVSEAKDRADLIEYLKTESRG